MKACILPLIIACIFYCSTSFAQTTGKALLKFENNNLTMGVSKQGQIIVSTEQGEVAFTDPGLFCVLFTQNLDIPDLQYKFAYK
jgi:hypothetical protein